MSTASVLTATPLSDLSNCSLVIVARPMQTSSFLSVMTATSWSGSILLWSVMMPGTLSVAPWQIVSTALSCIQMWGKCLTPHSGGLMQCRRNVSLPSWWYAYASSRSWSVTQSSSVKGPAFVLTNSAMCAPTLSFNPKSWQTFLTYVPAWQPILKRMSLPSMSRKSR